MEEYCKILENKCVSQGLESHVFFRNIAKTGWEGKGYWPSQYAKCYGEQERSICLTIKLHETYSFTAE